MRETKQAVIVLAKCAEGRKTYGLRVEKNGENQWLVTWAFPIKEDSAKREGYDKTTIQGNIVFTNDFPNCPYCGGRALTVCSCGHLSCTIIKNETFKCEWCGAQGKLGDYTGEAITAGMDV